VGDTIFYSWQSDRPSELCRGFVEDALRKAIKALRRAQFDVVERPDQDARDLAGSPEIDSAIAAKIDNSAAFVGDVTIVAPREGRVDALISSNVAVEVGFALKSLGEQRVILVANKHFGDQLPFNLRNRLIEFYDLPPRPDAERAMDGGDDGGWTVHRASEREKLADRLRSKLEQMLSGDPKGPPPTISAQLAAMRAHTAKEVTHFRAPVLGTLPAEYRTWLQLETLGECWERDAPSEEERTKLGEPVISSRHTFHKHFDPEQGGWVRKPPQ